MSNETAPRVGEAVAYRGAVASVRWVGQREQSPEGPVWLLGLDTHRGVVFTYTDHPEFSRP